MTLALIWLSALALAPGGDRSVDGVVLDPSGGVVPGASVSLKSGRGEVIAARVTDSVGAFQFTSVLAGAYVLEVHVKGFETKSVSLTVETRAIPAVKVVLAVARVQEDVDIGPVGDRPTTSAAENRDAISVDDTLFRGLPVFDQDYVSSLSKFLDPGAGSVSLIVDGMEATGPHVSASAIQEVKINQNPYSAEYFRPGRGRIEVITKPGTPEYHGEANVILRDSGLNAQPAFAISKAPEQRRIYEGYFSGPVARSRNIWFVLSATRKDDNLQSLVVARDLTGDIRQSVPTPRRDTEASLKLAHEFKPGHTVSLQYSYESSRQTNGGAGGLTLPAAAVNAFSREQNLVVDHRLVVSNSFVNQFRLGYEWNSGFTDSVSQAPRINVLGAFTAGGAQANQRQIERAYHLTNVATWTSGKHLVKAGFNVPNWSFRDYYDSTDTGGTYSFSTLQDYALGRPFLFTQQRGNGHIHFLQKELGAFAQDEIKLRKNLAIALGLRYDWQNFLTDVNNVAPRVFVSWAPGRTGKIVLRAGLGVFFDRTGAGAISDLLRYDGTHLLSYVVSSPTFPQATTTTSLPANLVVLDPAIRTPYSAQYSAGAEWQVAKAATLAVTYRGSRGVAQFRSRDVNAPAAPSFTARPDVLRGRVRQIESGGRQETDGLEISFRGKLGRIFNGVAQYTLSTARNDTGGIGYFPASSNDPAADWGRADFDQRHRLVGLGTFTILKAWKLGLGFNLATGRPYTLTTGRDDNHDGFAKERPQGVARNSIEGPGVAQIDIRIGREVRLSPKKNDESPALTFALDAFNVLNTVNYGTPVGDQSSPFFGTSISSLPPRQLQLGLRLTF